MSRIISTIPISVKSSKRVAKWFTVNIEDSTPQTYVKLQHRTQHAKKLLQHSLAKHAIWWRIFVLATIYTSCVINSYSHVITRAKSLASAAFYMSLLLDLVFALDVGVNAVGIFAKKRNRQVYALLLDVALVLPFWYVYLWFGKVDWIFACLRGVCVLRFYKISAFICNQRAKASRNPKVLIVVEMLVYGSIFLHASALLWYALACVNGGEKCAGWVVLLKDLQFEVKESFHWYFLAVYYSLMVNLNYGYLFDVRWIDKIGIGLSIFTTYFLSIYITSHLFLICLMHNKRKMHKHIQLEYLKARCGRLKQNTKELARIFQLEWTNKRGVRTAQIAAILPPNILADALFDINLPALKATLIFRSGSDAYLRQLSSIMKHEFLNEGDYIYRQGDEKNKMVVVTGGYVNVMSEEDDTSAIIAFGPGTCLGESALVYTLKSKSSIRAGEFVEFQVLYREDFYTSILHYPKQYNKIHRTVKSRSQEALIRKMNNFPFSSKATSIKKLKNTAFPEKGSLFSLYRIFQQKKILNFVHYESRLFLAWEIFVVVCALVVAIAYPYCIAFKRRFPAWFALPSTFIEVIFVADVFMQLIMLQVSKNREVAVKRVVLAKFNSPPIYLDIIAAFYFEYFCYLLKDHDRYYYVFKLNRLLKLHKFVPLVNRFEAMFAFGFAGIRCAKWLVLFAVFVFWATVFGYMLACFEEVCCPSGWFMLKVLEEKNGNTRVPMFSDRFALSLFYALSTVNGFELHEMHLRAVKDLVFIAVTLAIGSIMISLVLSDLSSLNFLKKKHRSTFLADLRSMGEFCRSTGVPERLKNRLFDYYRLQWDYDNCCSLYAPKTTNHRDEELLLHEVLECLKGVYVFAGIDESFIRDVAVRSKLYVLPPGDIVTYYGSMNKEMFVIKDGFYVYKTNGGVYRRLGPNSSFGICSLLFNLEETMLIRTLTHCKLISIDGSALQEALNLHPEVNAFMKELHKDIVYNNFIGESVSMPDFNQHEQRSRAAQSFRNLLKENFSRRAFLNVLSYCRKHKETYARPFKSDDTFFLLQFALLPTTIHPEGVFAAVWSFVRVACGYSYAILIPLQSISPDHFWHIIVVLDVVCVLDIYVMLHMAFYDERGVLVIHPLKSAGNYATRSFLVDFFLSFPYELVIRCLASKHNPQSYRIVRLIKLLHVYKTVAAFKYLQKIVQQKPLLLHFFKHVLALFFFWNAWSCILMEGTCSYINSRDYERMKNTEFNFYKRNVSGFYCRSQSWLDRSNYANFTYYMDVYSTAFYWTANLHSGLNFGDLQVQGGFEMLYAVLVQIFGLIYTCYLVVTLLPYCFNVNDEIIEYKRNLGLLMDLMKKEHVNDGLREKVERNAVYTWRRTHDVNTTKLFSCLHTTLLQDVLSFMYEETLKQVPLFSGMDRSFWRILAMVVKPQYFLEGQVIVEKDDIIDELYIVHRGTVNVELTRSTMKFDLIRGSVFGYYYNEAVPNMTITATAISNVDVLCIRTVDYYNILKNYSKFHGKIKDVVSEYKDFMPSKAQDKNAMSIIIWERQKSQTKLRRKCSRKHALMLIFYFDILVLLATYINSIARVTTFVTQKNTFFYWHIATELVFLQRLVVNFFTPYHDEYGELVTNRAMIKNNYLKNTKQVLYDFALSAIACGSISLFHPYLEIEHWFYYYTVVNLLSVSRILYFVQFFKKRRKDLYSSQICLNLLSFFIWVTLFLHYLTNIWIFIEHSLGKCNKKAYENYIHSLYFILNIITRTGLIEANVDSICEKSFVIAVLILRSFFFVLVLGAIISTLWILLKFPYKHLYLLQELLDYFTCADVDKYQIRKMLQYLKKFWKFDDAKQLSELLSKLPIPVKNEVKIAMYKPLLEKSFLFSNTETHFLENIALLVELDVYYGKDFIVRDGQIDENMYFIKSGDVEILTINSNHIENIHDVLHEGEMFGLAQGLFSGTPHQYTFRARTRCEILSLQLEKWDHLLGFYERSKDVIYKRIRNLHMQLNK